jgi:hypothetical protein
VACIIGELVKINRYGLGIGNTNGTCISVEIQGQQHYRNKVVFYLHTVVNLWVSKQIVATLQKPVGRDAESGALVVWRPRQPLVCRTAIWLAPNLCAAVLV